MTIEEHMDLLFGPWREDGCEFCDAPEVVLCTEDGLAAGESAGAGSVRPLWVCKECIEEQGGLEVEDEATFRDAWIASHRQSIAEANGWDDDDDDDDDEEEEDEEEEDEVA